MKIYELRERTPLIPALLKLWEDSVRATHHFLSDAEIRRIRGYVPQALQEVPHLLIAETDEGEPVGFLGMAERRLEMLFLAPDERGKGLGERLLRYAMENYGVCELTVNEQNPQAVGFYRRMGFRTYRRTDSDEAGDPYSLLYMRLEKKSSFRPLNPTQGAVCVVPFGFSFLYDKTIK